MLNLKKVILFIIGTNYIVSQTCQGCTFSGEYVCSTRTNITYPSRCHAECVSDSESLESGKCVLPCECPDVYEPVCGKDGKTYDNACIAQCSGTEVDSGVVGACECNCPSFVKPVCGNDQVTYQNYCYAGCKGVGVLYLKRCDEFPQIQTYPRRNTRREENVGQLRTQAQLNQLSDEQVRRLIEVLGLNN